MRRFAEDLVMMHGNELADELKSAARQDPPFATALRGVWSSAGTLEESVQRRLSVWTRPSDPNGPAL
jgi:hypothetical protein